MGIEEEGTEVEVWTDVGAGVTAGAETGFMIGTRVSVKVKTGLRVGVGTEIMRGAELMVGKFSLVTVIFVIIGVELVKKSVLPKELESVIDGSQPIFENLVFVLDLCLNH